MNVGENSRIQQFFPNLRKLNNHPASKITKYLIASIKGEYILFYRIGGELSHVKLVFKNGHVHKFTGDHDLQRFREALAQSVQPEPDDFWPTDDNINQLDT